MLHTTPQPMELFSATNTNVHVAVGNSLHKTTTLLQWTFNHFQNAEIVIIHVYQPSPVIPTLCKLNCFTFQCSISMIYDVVLYFTLFVHIRFFFCSAKLALFV